MSRRIALIMVASVLGISSHAYAQSPITVTAAKPVAGTFERIVSYGDLALASKAGRSTLMARVRSAAQDGCGSLYRCEPTHTTMSLRTRCVRNSVAAASPEIDRLVELAQAGHGSGTTVAIAVRR